MSLSLRVGSLEASQQPPPYPHPTGGTLIGRTVAGDRGTLRGIPRRIFKKLPCRGSIFVQLLVWDGPSLPVAPSHSSHRTPISGTRSHRLGEPHLTLAMLHCPASLPPSLISFFKIYLFILLTTHYQPLLSSQYPLKQVLPSFYLLF